MNRHPVCDMVYEWASCQPAGCVLDWLNQRLPQAGLRTAAVLYALDALRLENLIVSGGCPVPVNVEAILHGWRARWEAVPRRLRLWGRRCSARGEETKMTRTREILEKLSTPGHSRVSGVPGVRLGLGSTALVAAMTLSVASGALSGTSGQSAHALGTPSAAAAPAPTPFSAAGGTETGCCA